MKEIRICEIRADAAAGAEKALRLEGRPIVYDQPTKINDPAGAFIEVIRAGDAEWEELLMMTDDELYRFFYPDKFKPKQSYASVDYVYVHKEL